MADYELVIRKIRRLTDSTVVDVGIQDGNIVAVNPILSGKGEQEIVGEGRLLLPGFVDLHMHLDKSWLDDGHKWEYLTLMDAIQASRQEMQSRGWKVDEIYARALETVKVCLRKGTTSLRTHVDLHQDTGTAGIEALVKLREDVRPWIDIQVAAGAGDNYTTVPDGGEARLRQAMDLGADIVAGFPRLSYEPGRYLDLLFRVAKAYNTEIDIHIDESNDPDALIVEQYAEKAVTHGWQGKVTGSHVCSLYWVDDATAKRVISKFVSAQMKVIVNPISNLYIRGPRDLRLSTGPTRVWDLLDAGVDVGMGTDNTRDLFVPWGNADMLFSAMLLGLERRLGHRPIIETLLHMATSQGRRLLHLPPPYGVEEGAQADLVLVDALNPEEALVNMATRLYTIKRGQIVMDHGVLTPLDSL